MTEEDSTSHRQARTIHRDTRALELLTEKPHTMAALREALDGEGGAYGPTYNCLVRLRQQGRVVKVATGSRTPLWSVPTPS